MRIKRNSTCLYILIAGASLLGAFLYVVIMNHGTDVFEWLVLGSSNDWELADFFRHIGYSSDLNKTYYVSHDACFPPLAYLFFHVLYRLNPVPTYIDPTDWYAYVIYPYEILLFVFCAMGSAVMFYVAVQRFLKNQGKDLSLPVSLLLLTSAPLFIAIERGNPIFPVTVMLMWALYLRDEKEGWKRELALILISVAAGFKIYPAIFFLLYVREKRWKELIHLAIYGTTFFFVPFLFTDGVEGFRQFLHVLNQGHYSAGFMMEWSSVRGVCRSIFPKIGFSDLAANMLGIVAENVFLLTCVALGLLTRKIWKAVLFLSAAMTFYMPTSWCYNMVFYLLPLLLFWRDNEEMKGAEILYLILFAATFSVPVWGLHRSITRLICVPGYLLWLVVAVEELKNFWDRKNPKARKKTTVV